MAVHNMTPARKAALKRAQQASAAKRRGKGKGKLAAANRKLGKRKTGFTKMAVVAGVSASIAAVAASKYHKAKIAPDHTQASNAIKHRTTPQSGNLKTKSRYKSPHVNHRAVKKIVHSAMLKNGIKPNSGFKRKY